MNKEEIIKGIRINGVYDFIAVNYWKLTKEQLKEIMLELAYITTMTTGTTNEMLKELEERL